MMAWASWIFCLLWGIHISQQRIIWIMIYSLSRWCYCWLCPKGPAFLFPAEHFQFSLYHYGLLHTLYSFLVKLTRLSEEPNTSCLAKSSSFQFAIKAPWWLPFIYIFLYIFMICSSPIPCVGEVDPLFQIQWYGQHQLYCKRIERG